MRQIPRARAVGEKSILTFFSPLNGPWVRTCVRPLNGPWGEQWMIYELLFHDAEHTENRSSHVSVQHDKIRLVKTKKHAWRFSFSQSNMDNISSDSGFLRQIAFLINESFTPQDLRTLRALLFRHQKPERYLTRWIAQRKILVWCRVHANGEVGPYSFNIQHQKESTNVQCSEPTSRRKLKTSGLMLCSC